jgi:hypothetical protein
MGCSFFHVCWKWSYLVLLNWRIFHLELLFFIWRHFLCFFFRIKIIWISKLVHFVILCWRNCFILVLLIMNKLFWFKLRKVLWALFSCLNFILNLLLCKNHRCLIFIPICLAFIPLILLNILTYMRWLFVIWVKIITIWLLTIIVFCCVKFCWVIEVNILVYFVVRWLNTIFISLLWSVCAPFS